MEPTLLVLAAGMGSRYGGLKQMDPLGPGGETLLDYSVYDAMQSGFARVVFVIRRDFEDDFRERVGRRFEERIDVGYVFQELNDLPGGFGVPEDRLKPWGTGHAIWCAREAVDMPFLAINADDFYGRPAIHGVGEFLQGQPLDGTAFCMAGYRLAATLSGAGTVSRGICRVSNDGVLESVKEFTKLEADGGHIVDRSVGAVFTGEERVSLNCWGFTPAIFPKLEELFEAFLAGSASGGSAEFYIPNAVEELVRTERAVVHVLPTESPWFGVTYREDRTIVVAALAGLSADYPSPLWD